MVGAEQRKARLASFLHAKSVLVNGVQYWCSRWAECPLTDASLDVTAEVRRCCGGSWTSTQRSCIRFCVERAASAAHAVMAKHELVVEPGGRSWLHCSALAAASGCCRLEHRIATSYSSPVWSVWGCRLVSLQLDGLVITSQVVAVQVISLHITVQQYSPG